MKKLVSSVLAASMVMSLAACGSTASTDSAADSSAASAASSAATTEAAGEGSGAYTGTPIKIGGIGSIPGAFLGGILLGIIENLSKAYISTQLSDAIVFLVLVVVLIVKPTGLLGKKVNVKV